MTQKLIAAFVVLLLALGMSLTSPAAAEGTSNYCGVVESTTAGTQVATGFWYTDDAGRRYCRQISDTRNYVCMTAGTRTFTQTVSEPAELFYTFRYVTKRPVPDASSFKPSGPYNAHAVNVGSLSRPVWQSSGAHATPEEQAEWDAQFTRELVAVSEIGEPIPSPLPVREGWDWVDIMVSVPGAPIYRPVETRVPATFITGHGNCAPAGALPKFDKLPSSGYRDTRTDRQRCDHDALNRGMHDYVCDGAAPTRRQVRHTPDPSTSNARHKTLSEGENGDIVEAVCTEVSNELAGQTSWFCE